MDDQKQRLIQLFNSRYGSFLHTVRFSSYGDHLCPICGVLNNLITHIALGARNFSGIWVVASFQ